VPHLQELQFSDVLWRQHIRARRQSLANLDKSWAQSHQHLTGGTWCEVMHNELVITENIAPTVCVWWHKGF